MRKLCKSRQVFGLKESGLRQRGSKEGLSLPWECSWDGLCRVHGSARKVLPSSQLPGQARPTCRPEGSVLLTLGSGGAGLPWSPVRDPGWPASLAGAEGCWSGGAAPAARSRPGLSQLSVQSVQELVGESMHMEPGPGHIRPLPVPAPRRLSILCPCICPPGCLPPPRACSVSGRVTGQMFFVSSPRALELGISNR